MAFFCKHLCAKDLISDGVGGGAIYTSMNLGSHLSLSHLAHKHQLTLCFDREESQPRHLRAHLLSYLFYFRQS